MKRMNAPYPTLLHPNLLVGSIQLLAWLLFLPSQWRKFASQLDPTLPPDFDITQLLAQQWHNPITYRLLVQGYMLLPLLLACVAGSSLWWLNPLSGFAIYGLLLGIFLGLLIGIVVNMASGIAVATITGSLFTTVWGLDGLLMVDLILSTKYAFLFGTTSAVVIHVTNNIGEHTRSKQHIRQVGTFAVGFSISLIGGLSIILLIAFLAQQRQSDTVSDWLVPFITSAISGLLIGGGSGWKSQKWVRGLIVGSLIFLVVMMTFGDAARTFDRDPSGMQFIHVVTLIAILLYSSLYMLAYLLAEGFVGPRLGAIIGGAGGLAIHYCIQIVMPIFPLWNNLIWAVLLLVLGITAQWWRPILVYPLQVGWNLLIYQIEFEQTLSDREAMRSRCQNNAAFWDELQWLPLYGLDAHLIFTAEQFPQKGQQAIEQISHGRQRWAAQSALLELDARMLETCATVEEIAGHSPSEPAEIFSDSINPLLRTFYNFGKDAQSALEQVSSYNQRLALDDVGSRLNDLARELLRSNDPHASRFMPIAETWHSIITRRSDKIAAAALREKEIPNPYVVGNPITRQQELFVGRTDISLRIEGLLRDDDHPPILLFGQRRMGKTSLLYQLRRMLPHRILPVSRGLTGPNCQFCEP